MMNVSSYFLFITIITIIIETEGSGHEADESKYQSRKQKDVTM
jgi:hypothetical protein